MRNFTLKFTLLFLFASAAHAQLGFCPGSKGEPIFTENFGNGTTYGPALPAGITTYPFVTGAPNDGQYTLYYHSSLYTTWHYSLDHTPDATNGPNGKMLLVNANAATSGDFYKKTVSGLCVNTTFEFSAWLMNVYNPNTNYCGAGQIPINVRFEIWNASETILLGSGNTGNLMGTTAPLWQQFALVFTTVNETSVVLKMKNNGTGGCGNDLAIDDISFSACGDLTTVSSPSATGSSFATCSNPASLQLNASTVSAVPYFYQWQSSSDGTTWADIPGATNASYNATNITSTTYFRVKAAQDAVNLNSSFCSAISNVFTVSILPTPIPGTNNGDQTICSNESIPTLGVTAAAGTGVNWYSAASGGTLLQSNSPTYTPTTAGIFYAETYDLTSNCIATPRTPVQLMIVALPTATISGTTSICSGNSAIISFSGTPNAIVTYAIDAGANQTITLNASGAASVTTSASSTYTLAGVSLPSPSTCSQTLTGSASITVTNLPTASVSSVPLVCSGSSAVVNFSGTAGAIVTYKVNAGANQTITLNGSGTASVTIPSVTTAMTYTLVNVALPGPSGCSQTLSQSITISPVAIPTASISANPTTVCSGQSSTIMFTGTANATVTYTIDGGANQTITLNASGSATIAASGLTSNRTYSLVNVTSADLNTCSNSASGSVTITVNGLPTATISNTSPVCSGSSAAVNFSGTPNAIVTYSVNSGANQTISLNGSGNASVTVPSVTSATTYTLISVNLAATGCSQALSQSTTVSAVALPTASISANPMTVCSGQNSIVSLNGTPNAVVTYTINAGANQTVTLDASGQASFANPFSSNTTYQLVSVALAGTGCSQTLTGFATVSVNPTPIMAYSGDLSYCEGESVAINLTSDIAGTTFSWTVVENGTSGATSDTGNQIAQTLALTNGNVGTATYTVTPFYNGCPGIPVAITVTIYPLPVPQITDGVICTTGSGANQFYTLDTNLDPATHSFQWFFGPNLIPTASGSTYDANQIGTYSVIATNAQGCASLPVEAVVSEMSQGESLVIQQSSAFSDNPTVTITVVGGDGPYSYQLDDTVQSSNVFRDVSAGTHTITVFDAFCTNLTATVTIVNYPKYFTPNSDGIHDTWNIVGIGNAVIRIYDRYGKLIKQISPDGSGWDGNYNGRALPSTDYWFTIDYIENALNKTFNAHFALKR
ncbi:MAG: T9SS type B sorting domain-containing protein [Flavobacterium sp.]|uniref:T9SS type B sorting domain-containing protein n=1 Tax=Flavobacterium sp. TaxID=239 RepID=UPI0011F7E136|nr:T9SS type B sorting domain-containing protein [Flavobacterium sp.]RZJ68691.1 MAG: T9SS type B sorting domain-containing protein [Flavobacterium sp.]